MVYLTLFRWYLCWNLQKLRICSYACPLWTVFEQSL